MMNIQIVRARAIDKIIRAEGGYVNNPNDSGGETSYGITVAVARESGYDGPMRLFSREAAVAIYSAKYWDAVRGNELAAVSEQLADEVVDTAVNMGVSRAGEFLQSALNGLTGHNLATDGRIGPATLKALGEYMAHRNDPETLVKALNCLQGAYYIVLTERRTKDKAFLYGWLKNRVVL